MDTKHVNSSDLPVIVDSRDSMLPPDIVDRKTLTDIVQYCHRPSFYSYRFRSVLSAESNPVTKGVRFGPNVGQNVIKWDKPTPKCIEI